MLEAGGVQLNVGGVILDVEEDSTVGDLSFESDSMTVIMSLNQSLKISSSENRLFTVSPTSGITRTCPTGKSVLQIQPVANSVSYSISLGSSGTCVVEDGGAGGGGEAGGEAEAPPAEAPPVEAPPVEAPPAEAPPVEAPPVEAPPAEAPPVEAPPASTPSAGVGVAQGAAQGAGEIGQGIIQAAGSVGSGITQIVQGITSGSTGSAFIAQGVRNTGSYVWDTNTPLYTPPGYTPMKLTEASTYAITIISVADASIQDTSDSPFSFISLVGSALPSSPVSFFRNFIKNIAIAQEKNSLIKITYPNGGETFTIGETYTITWDSENLLSGDLVNISITRGFKLTESIKQVNKEVKKAVSELRATPIVTKTIKETIAPVTAVASALSAGAIAASASAGSASIALNLSEVIQVLSMSRFYLLGLLRFKRKKPWGRVLDRFSGKPLRAAMVQIYELEFQKLKDTQLTDEEGRFGTLIAPGKYYLKVSKKGFETKKSEIIGITQANQVLDLEITLSPLEAEFSLENIRRINFFNALKRFINAINPFLLFIGTVVSILILVIVPTIPNYLIFFVYIVFDLLKVYFAFHLIKPFGKVLDQVTGETLSLAVVRIFDEENNWLLATKVTDDLGRFNFLLEPGRYYITCSRAGFAPYRSETIVLTKASAAAPDIKMAKAGPIPQAPEISSQSVIS